jgi:adenylate cyclase
MQIPLEDIRVCFEGVIPSGINTCSADGMPNMTYLSHVQYVDSEHVALSCQFFNKTRKNLMENARAAVLVVDPQAARQFELDVLYLRTETSGPLFEKMKLRLDVLASLSGMTGRFQLLGADIFKVLDCRPEMGGGSTSVKTAAPPLERVALLSTEMAACEELSVLLEVTLAGLARHLAYKHAMVLLVDESSSRLYTIASHGFAESGVGSEVPLGAGPIGVAAERGIPIRTTNVTRDILYGRAVRQALAQRDDPVSFEEEIELPGLPEVRSLLAMPIRTRERTLGVLCVQSAQPYGFTEHDELVLRVIADHLATAALLSSQLMELLPARERPAESAPAPVGPPILIRHYSHDHSIFIGGDYLIKGVAGAILWKLVSSYVREGRTQFTNRELRLDRDIGLPDLSDNLEARLVLLKRRLDDRASVLRIEKEGRGRLRLAVARPVDLQEVST